MKHYRIVPNDVIVAGSISYSFDPGAKKITYHVKATVKKWFITKEIDESGTLPVSPDDFLSEKFKNVGKGIRFGPLKVLIRSVKNNAAKADVVADIADVRGTSKYDLSEKYVSLLTANVSGSYMGVEFTIDLEPA